MRRSQTATEQKPEARDDTDILLETVQSELSGTRDTIVALLKSADQVLAIGTTVLVAIAFLALRTATNEVAPIFRFAPIAAPVIFCLLAAYWIRLRTAISALGGYKAALEEWLVCTAGHREIRLWESGGAENMKARFGYRFNMFLNASAYLATNFLACFRAAEIGWAINPILVAAYWTLLALLAAGLAIAVRDSGHAFAETRANALLHLPTQIRALVEEGISPQNG
jgi:hypothetical protein